jgi:hypothetical protein
VGVDYNLEANAKEIARLAAKEAEEAAKLAEEESKKTAFFDAAAEAFGL